MRVDPKLLVLLLVVVAIAAVVRLGNPHRKYSTREFWETATVATVPGIGAPTCPV